MNGQRFLYLNGTTNTTIPAVNIGPSSFTVALWVKTIIGRSQVILISPYQFAIEVFVKGNIATRLWFSHEEASQYAVR